ncbi:HdeD family acid-resistance protein [Chloroflexota bacterium]
MERPNYLTSDKWWVLLIRGIMAIIVGIVAIRESKGTIMVLVLFIGYYLIIEGFLKLYWAYVTRKAGDNMWPSLLSGLVSLTLGVMAIAWPELTVVVLIALIATHAIFQGGADIVSAMQGRGQLDSKRFWLLMVGGIIQVLFGIWIIFNPIIGGLTVLTVLGIYAIVLGFVLIIRAFQEKSGGTPGSLAAA